jgi:hypothetical protein
VIIDDLDIFGVALRPSEADTPLIINPNAHLSCPVPFQNFESITRWIPQVFHCGRRTQLSEFPQPPLLNIAWEFAAGLTLPDSFRFLAFE